MATTPMNGDDGAVQLAAAQAETGRRQWRWGLRYVKWRLVLRAQHWGVLFLIVPATVVTGVSHYSFQRHLRVRHAFLYDATISYPIVEGVAVPDSLAALYPWIAFICALVVTEAGLFWGRHSASAAAAAFLHFGISGLCNFLIVLAVAETTKPWAGHLRPDFLHRCQPAALGNVSPDTLAAAAGGQLPLGSLGVFQVAAECTNPDLATLDDGRLSFPSGHASNTLSVAWFAGLYMVWSLHIREGSPCLAHHVRNMTHGDPWWRRALREALNAAAFAYIIFSVCIGWFIGISRLWDNRHHTADIVGGFLLAVMLSTFTVIKAIGQYAVIKAQLDAASWDQKKTLLPVAAAGPAAVAPAGLADGLAPALPHGAGAAHAPAAAASNAGGGAGAGGDGGGAGEVAMLVMPPAHAPGHGHAAAVATPAGADAA